MTRKPVTDKDLEYVRKVLAESGAHKEEIEAEVYRIKRLNGYKGQESELK